MRAFVFLSLFLSIPASSFVAAGEPETPLTTLKKARLAYEDCNVRALMQLTAPDQREVLSDQAIAQAETHCKGDEKHAWMAQALKSVEDVKPTYEKDGTIAVFDFSGRGFSKADERLQMILVEGKWYLLH